MFINHSDLNSLILDENETVTIHKLEAKSRPKRGIRVFHFYSGGSDHHLSFWDWLLIIFLVVLWTACEIACGMLCQKEPEAQTQVARDNRRRITVRAIPMPWYDNYRQFSNDCGGDSSRLITLSRVAVDAV